MSHHEPHGKYQKAIAAATTLEELPKREMKVTEAAMMRHQVPLNFRDYCAHLLIPLNQCRYENYFAPWSCQPHKHAYEKCQYEDHLWRQKKAQLMKADQEAKKAAAEKSS